MLACTCKTVVHFALCALECTLPTQLLCRNPRTLREADFFLREAIDLSLPEKQEAKAHSSRSVIEVGAGLAPGGGSWLARALQEAALHRTHLRPLWCL